MLDFAIFAVTFLLALVAAVLYLYPVTADLGLGLRLRRVDVDLGGPPGGWGEWVEGLAGRITWLLPACVRAQQPGVRGGNGSSAAACPNSGSRMPFARCQFCKAALSCFGRLWGH